MPLTINTRTYTADTQANNAWIYRDSASTAAHPSGLKLGRTPPKAVAGFAGQSKSECKFTKTMAIGVAATPLPAIIRAESSIPVGMVDADLDILIADFRSYVASTAFADLVKTAKIYHA